MPSEKVNKVMEVIRRKPQLVVAMNSVLAVAYVEADVTLNNDEKEELYKAIGHAIKINSVTG